MSERATNCFTFSALEKISLANISMNRGASSITAKIFILIGVISYNLQRGEFLLVVKRRETLTGTIYARFNEKSHEQFIPRSLSEESTTIFKMINLFMDNFSNPLDRENYFKLRITPLQVAYG